jgi:hypothetical protein
LRKARIGLEHSYREKVASTAIERPSSGPRIASPGRELLESIYTVGAWRDGS